MTRTALFGACACLLLAACDGAAPDPANEADAAAPAQSATPAIGLGDRVGNETALPQPAERTAAHRFADWAGKWIGVEGMYATITPTASGRYRLEMQSDLDTNRVYEGRDSENGIAFDRGGKTFSLHRASGENIGLKWLDGKNDCLMVQDGEGYCRD